jgi:TonB family protein
VKLSASLSKRLLPAMIVGWAAIATSPPAAAEAAGQETGPLLKADLIRMLVASNYTTAEVLRIVRMSCVDFRPTPRDRADLASLPGGSDVLIEINRCRRSGQAAGYRNGLPRASRVAVATNRPEREDVVLEAPIPKDDLVSAPSLPTPGFAAVIPEEELVLAAAETPPRLLNWEQVAHRLLEEYRPTQRREGTVLLRLHVDADGQVSGPEVRASSGDPGLDAAALASVPVMRFAPATSRDRSVASWTDLPIRFETP